jgi:hypothetical protein
LARSASSLDASSCCCSASICRCAYLPHVTARTAAQPPASGRQCVLALGPPTRPASAHFLPRSLAPSLPRSLAPLQPPSPSLPPSRGRRVRGSRSQPSTQQSGATDEQTELGPKWAGWFVWHAGVWRRVSSRGSE